MQKLTKQPLYIYWYTLFLFLALAAGTVELNGQTSQQPSHSRQKNNAVKKVREVSIKGLDRKADLVAAGKLINSDNDQLVVCDDSLVNVYNVVKNSAHLLFSVPLEHAVQKIAIGDADNDGHNDLVAVTGKSGYAQNIDIDLFIIKKNGDVWQPVSVYTKKSERPHTTFVAVSDLNGDGRNEIILSYFESKYLVETVAVRRDQQGRWQHRIIEKKRMAMAKDIGLLPDEKNIAVVVGRPYGDSVGMVGDAYLLREEKKSLPAFRGVKAVKIGDLDGDGKNEIFVGDGWHQDYGKIARGRVAMISYTDMGYKYELIEDVKGQYEISQIDIRDINGDGKNELLANGNKFFRIYTKAKDGWKVFTDDAIMPAPFTVGDINGDHYPDVVFAGKDKISVYNFKDLVYRSDLGKELITEKIDPASLVGKKAPELVADKWYNGSLTGLKSIRGKVVVLDFWATWCKPCIKMFPTLRGWQEKYGEEGLVILGLTKQDNIQDLPKIEAFIQKEKFPYRIGVTEEALNNLSYGVGGIPHMVLIDKEGIVRRFEVGAGDGKDFEQDIQKYLQQ